MCAKLSKYKHNSTKNFNENNKRYQNNNFNGKNNVTLIFFNT